MGVHTNMKVIVFRLKDEKYGVDVQHVQSIERMQHITRVPDMPDFVKGVMNLRGEVISVIDLRERFGLEATEYNHQTRIIITSMNDNKVGMVVDDANEVIDIEETSIEPPPENNYEVKTEYIQGVAPLEDQLIILLNLSKVLNETEEKEVEKTGNNN